MIARNARKADADAIDRLLHHNLNGDVRLERDVLIVSGEPLDSVLVWRPCALVHEFECPGLLSANALVNYAVGQGAGRVMPFRDVLFLVDPKNEAMLRHVQRLRATELTGRVFTLDVG